MAKQNKKANAKVTKKSSTQNQTKIDVKKGKYAQPKFNTMGQQNSGYNITTDRKTVNKEMDSATRGKGTSEKGQLKASENQTAQQKQAAQNDTMLALRQAAAAELGAGASLGAAAANQAAAVYDNNAQSAQLQSELSLAREEQLQAEEQEIFDNLASATEYTDANRNELLTNAVNRYGIDHDMLGAALEASASYKGMVNQARNSRSSYGGGGYSYSGGGGGTSGGGTSSSGDGDALKKYVKDKFTRKRSRHPFIHHSVRNNPKKNYPGSKKTSNSRKWT